MENIGSPTLSNRISGQDHRTEWRSPVTQFIAGIISLLLLLTPAAALAKAGIKLIDPVFGLKYDATRIKFEEAPPSLTTRCPALTSQMWDSRLWIYGKQDNEGTQYLLVGGLLVERATGRSEPNPVGSIVALTPEKCTLVGPAREELDVPIDLPANLAPRLIDDVVQRYRTAFGGASALETALKAQHIDLSNAEELRRALAK